MLILHLFIMKKKIRNFHIYFILVFNKMIINFSENKFYTTNVTN